MVHDKEGDVSPVSLFQRFRMVDKSHKSTVRDRCRAVLYGMVGDRSAISHLVHADEGVHAGLSARVHSSVSKVFQRRSRNNHRKATCSE